MMVGNNTKAIVKHKPYTRIGPSQSDALYLYGYSLYLQIRNVTVLIGFVIILPISIIMDQQSLCLGNSTVPGYLSNTDSIDRTGLKITFKFFTEVLFLSIILCYNIFIDDTCGSVLLAGVLLKVGSYGLMRFTLTLFPVGYSY